MAGNRVISAVLTLKDKDFSSGIKKSASATKDMERKVKYAGNTVSQFGKSAVSSFTSVAKSAVGLAAAYMGINAVKDLGVSMVESAANAQAMNAQFEQVFSGMESAAESSLANVASETNMLSERLKGSFLGMAAFAKTTGMDTASALELTERATLAAADSSAFYDKSIESVSESLQSFLKGNFENDAALGISATETTRNAAANKLYGKSFKDLSESQKQLTLLQMVEDGNKLSGALGQAAREGDGYENVLGNLRSTWNTLKAKLGEPILEPVITGMKGLTTWIGNVNTDSIVSGFDKVGGVVKGTISTIKPGLNWLKDTALPSAKDGLVDMYVTAQPGLNWMKDVAFPGIVEGAGAVVVKFKDVYSYVKDKWSLIGPVVAGVAAGVTAYKVGVVAVTAATKTWQIVTTGAQIATALLNGTLAISPLGWVAMAIGAVVVAGIALYKNWDVVKEKAQQLWDKTKIVGQGVKIAFTVAFNGVKQVAGNALNFVIDKINSVINTINKIPGVNIPIVPKVDWGFAKSATAPATNKGKAAIASYDVGTNRVTHDQVAQIHKDEMIVPAVQARNLRRRGMTIDNIDQQSVVPVYRASGGSQRTDGLLVMLAELIQLIKNMPKGDVYVTIDGYNKSVTEIINELIPLLKLRIANM